MSLDNLAQRQIQLLQNTIQEQLLEIKDLKSEMDSIRQLKQIAQEAMAKNFEVIEDKTAEIQDLRAALRGSQKDSMDFKIQEQAEIIESYELALREIRLGKSLDDMDNFALMAGRLVSIAKSALDRVKGK